LSQREPSQQPSQPEQQSPPKIQTQTAVDISEQRRGVEELASQWLAALKSQDVASIVSVSEVPYYFDNEVLTSRDEVATRYHALFASKPNAWNEWRITSIKAMTLA